MSHYTFVVISSTLNKTPEQNTANSKREGGVGRGRGGGRRRRTIGDNKRSVFVPWWVLVNGVRRKQSILRSTLNASLYS